MSSSFPQFSVDEIILRHGSQDLYFMIVHSSITLTSAKPGAHSMIKFKMSLTFSRTFSKEKIPVRLLPKPELSGTIFCTVPKFWNNVPEISGLGKKRFRKSFRNSGFSEPFPQWK